MANMMDQPHPGYLPAPEAGELVDECKKRLMSMRAVIEEKVSQHRDLVDFYVREMEVINEFLSSNFFNEDMKAMTPVEPPQMPASKAPEPYTDQAQRMKKQAF